MYIDNHSKQQALTETSVCPWNAETRLDDEMALNRTLIMRLGIIVVSRFLICLT
jgi:hypothetical protein